ncbi:OLC1v1011186C1 [Oldenlandia corymbosa var. corymbosa]|uniref:Protein farnesyltransferase subunit beta n=1 Tax=Oldenlandia corymbosa var. corymbosa TaxID=529605 RepID=A0AAV1DVG7_OLDCO|nr:OLC1v1011186C1 [Oldenlandia corymbosa var. corymbosa]
MEQGRVPGTRTQEEQWMVEGKVFDIYAGFHSLPPNSQSAILEIRRENHVQYLTRGLLQLGPSFCVLDANRPWICYWILHSIAVLGESVDPNIEANTIDFLCRCQDPDGGYGGGPGQMPHLATTFAAVNALLTLGSFRALSSINRGKLHKFLLRMKDTSGGFRMHDGGEIDVRACYTAIAVASILNILDDPLVQNVGDYISSCQTYEGGISGEPGSEAHGGYTYCGLAAMVLINEVHRLDLPRLIDWVVFRQGMEGGFQGRTNKLVDGCYSFWQGGVAAIFQVLHPIICDQLGLPKEYGSHVDSESDYDSESSDADAHAEPLTGSCHFKEEGQDEFYCPSSIPSTGIDFIRSKRAMKPIFNSIHLQKYLLLCSQEEAGFRDKPGKSRDHYHTCYCLSGLSLCQYCWTEDTESPPLPRDVLGSYSNLLEEVHPLYNIVLDRYQEAHEFFSSA